MIIKPGLLKLLLAGILALSFGCQTQTVEQLAEKDANLFFSNLDNSEKLAAHPMSLRENFPEEFAEQQKTKFLKKLQDYFEELCSDSKDFKLLKTYRKIGDNDQKVLFLEYEFCESGLVIMGYEVKENEVSLFSIWPMRKEEKPAILFTEEQSW